MQQQPYLIENKGTLSPGQTISVNKYTVQVERYLSQGGFSYVYLVKTATPVYNTTHHVLKRIAVPNEAMLTEVKKEVDIMRILKGHPNVVHLIDAAWHRMSNGQYEVFILMEFCPGGGIIDMMNRRLRERLTEAEILQIFVDVLEGVAAMHNLRPALLHRDLKVENILQSSSTSFKLCDFGSATPVGPRPPSTTQEIRALEAELNRHTTLQYRPPEMIDPYLRRPIDEKSDVWALGVLLYKLCYYTTPFEEHGPLAILNVQYRIPPYPVYSPQLNSLIVSMLREHGTQRPSAFELLAQVHRMRDTKSRFTYNIPPQQPLSPRTLQSQSATSLDNLVSYRPSSAAASNTQRSSPAKGAGVHAREKVLEAIAPMRRGRPPTSQLQEPTTSSASRPPTPPKVPVRSPKSMKPNLLDDNFGAEEDNAWKFTKSSVPGVGDVKPHSSGGAIMSAWKPKGAPRAEADATWSVESLTSKVTDSDVRLPPGAFGDNFGEKLWNEFDDNNAGPTANPPLPADKPTSKLAPPPEGSRTTKLVITKGKDAFEGLGLAPSMPPAPTLGEARKLRTGLAAVNAYNRSVPTPGASVVATKPKLGTSNARPTPSPRPSLAHQSSSWKASPVIQPAQPSTSSVPPILPQISDLSPETRFPSLEELDATFVHSQKPAPYTPHVETTPGTGNIIDLSVPSTSSIPQRTTPQRSFASSSLMHSSARSEPVTGAMNRDLGQLSRTLPSLDTGEGFTPSKRSGGRPPSRSSLSRRLTASASSKNLHSQDLVDLTGSSNSASLIPPAAQKSREYRDWLTGDTDGLTSPLKDRGFSDTNPPGTPVLREFTHKRSSFIEESNVHIQSPQEAITGQQSSHQVVRVSTPPSPTKRTSRGSRSKERKQGTSLPIDNKSPLPPAQPLPTPLTRHAKPSRDPFAQPISRPSFERSSSSGDWKPQPALDSPRDGRAISSDEESPEDAVGFKVSRSVEKSTKARKGRQSSVHDLVDLWGGGVVQTRERRKDSGPGTTADPPHDAVTKLHRSRSIATKANTGSPQRLQPPNSGAVEVSRSPSRSPNRRSPSSSHMKQMSVVSSPSPSSVPASRGRPQSLFVFPMSKASSDGKLDTPPTPSGLSVPQDGSRQNGPRRTSITDMVHRYEAIGRVAASPISKSAGASGVISTTPGRTFPQPPSPAVSKFTPSRVSLPSEDPILAADTDKRQPTMNARPHYTGQMDRAADPLRSQNSVPGLPTSSSSKIMSLGSSQGAIDGLPPGFANAAAPTEEDPRAPSPEKPYQGVGKLIDQWQRKSEEASRGPAPRRGGFPPRRAGLVSGGTGRDN